MDTKNPSRAQERKDLTGSETPSSAYSQKTVKKARAALERDSSRSFLVVMRDDAGSGVLSTVTHPAGKLCMHICPRVQEFPLAVPPAQFVTDARTVVANPEQYHDRPLLRRFAWMTLMTARGCTVDQNRLAQMPVEMAQ